MYFSCVDVLDRAGAGARATVNVHDEEGALAFEISEHGAGSAAGSDADLERLRDRVEALGGQLAVRGEPGHGTRVTGSLPLSR